jgi:hypothetical protein
MSVVGAMMGMHFGAQAQARKDYIQYLTKANAVSPATAKSLSEVKFSRCTKGFECAYPKALEYLLKKGKIIKTETGYYLNSK